MDRWRDRYLDGGTDEWVDGLTFGWMDGWTNGWMNFTLRKCTACHLSKMNLETLPKQNELRDTTLHFSAYKLQIIINWVNFWCHLFGLHYIYRQSQGI